MCEICQSSPCLSRCPNASAPKTVHVCDHCGEPIVVGETYYTVRDLHYHEDCFTDCAAGILTEKFGAIRDEATEEDLY